MTGEMNQSLHWLLQYLWEDCLELQEEIVQCQLQTIVNYKTAALHCYLLPWFVH